MSKSAIQTAQAPQAIGPYSQAIEVAGFVYCSGQIALSPESGTMIDGDVRAQTRRAMDNLTAVLSAAGASWEHVVRTTIYLTDLGDFGDVNEVYAEYISGVAPARATVEVGALPKGAAVEIDAIAFVGETRS